MANRRSETPEKKRFRRGWIWLGAALLGLVTTASLAAATNFGQAWLRVHAPRLASRPQPAVQAFRPLPGSEFQLGMELIPWLDSGVEIDAAPPPGWSHLVVKNNVRVANAEAAGPQADTGESWNELLESFSLAVVADVQPGGRGNQRFHFERLGMGWCRDVEGRPTVVSTSTFHQQQIELPPVVSFLLAMQELNCEQNMAIRAKSPCTWFYDVQRCVLLDGQHVQGIMRHALLVHPQTGELANFAWIVPPAGSRPQETSYVEKFPANFVTTFELHWQPNSGKLRGVPSENDYAVVRLPKGERQIAIEGKLADTFHAHQFTLTMAREAEAMLRKELGWGSQAAPPASDGSG